MPRIKVNLLISWVLGILPLAASAIDLDAPAASLEQDPWALAIQQYQTYYAPPPLGTAGPVEAGYYERYFLGNAIARGTSSGKAYSVAVQEAMKDYVKSRSPDGELPANVVNRTLSNTGLNFNIDSADDSSGSGLGYQ